MMKIVKMVCLCAMVGCSVFGKTHTYEQTKIKLPSFSKVAVTLKDSDLLIKKSDDENCYIEYNQESKKRQNPVHYEIQDDTLTVTENGNTGSSYKIILDEDALKTGSDSNSLEIDEATEYKNYVTLYLPADKKLSLLDVTLVNGDFYSHILDAENGEINIENGDFNLAEGRFDALSIDMGDGDFAASSLIAENMQLSMDSGDCDMKNALFTDAELTAEDGDITIKDFSFSGVIDIYNSDGDTDITVSSEVKGTVSLNLNSDEGDVSVLNLNEREDIKKKTNANAQMNIDSDDGDIVLRY